MDILAQKKYEYQKNTRQASIKLTESTMSKYMANGRPIHL